MKDVDLNPKEHDENEPLPVVDGEIEVVEVKSGNPTFRLIRLRATVKFSKMVSLRYFHVDIVSFKRNYFEIVEKTHETN